MKASQILKGLATALTLTVTAAGLVACGQQSKAATDKVTHITYWHVNAKTQGGQAVDDLVAQFNKSHKHVQVTAKYNPNMYQGLMQNLQSAQASNKVPDLVQVGWSYMNYFADNFKYQTPAEAAKQFDGNQKFLTSNFTAKTLNFAKNSKGNVVGLPYSLSTPIFYVNNTLLSKYGIKATDLTTWEAVQKAAAIIKAKATGEYGLYIQEPGDTWAQQALMLSNGASIVKHGKASFASPEGVHAYQLYQDMVVKDHSAIHAPWDQGVNDFVSGKVAMLFTTVAQAAHIKASAKFDASAQVAPTFAGHALKVPVGGSMLAITAQAKPQQKAAWTFEKFLYHNDSLVTWSKGTGYLPPTTKALNSDAFKAYLKENPMLVPATETFTNAVPWTSFPKNGLDAEQAMIDARDKILSGSNVKAALQTAQEKINAQQGA
ncbi:ABC transporter substrate-binding protein [Lacticaseibacillus sp. GG6-2]